MKFFYANKFIIAALTLCLSACVFVFIISVKQTKKVANTSVEVIHTNRVLGNIDNLITTSLELQNSTREFVLTGNENVLAAFKSAPASYNNALVNIKQQEGRSKIYSLKLDTLETLIKKRLLQTKQIISLKKEKKTDAAAALMESAEMTAYDEKIRSICEAIKENELKSQDKTRTANEKAIQNLNSVLYFALILVAVLGILLFVKVKKSFNEHRTGEERFKALLESAPDAMLISDNNGNIQLSNKRATDLLGYSREELTGMPVENLIPISVRDKHRMLRENYANSPRLRDINTGVEMQAMDKAGSVIPVEISLSPIDTNGEVLVAAALRDVSQRKAAQHEIQTLFTQINQASEAIYSVNSHFVIESWNKGAENLYGFSKAEAIGKNSLELLKTELSKDDMENAMRQIEQTGFWSGEVKRFTRQGNEIYVYSSLSQVKENNGSPRSYVSVSFDITERKKLEEQVKHLASIVENSSEAILSRDLNRNIISWNKGAERMFGYTREEAIGKSVTDLGLMRITEDMKQHIENAITQKGEFHEEIEYYHKDGHKITGSVTGNAVHSSEGKLVALSFVIKDISARKQLEQHLRSYNEKLEQKISVRTREITLSEEKYKLLYNNNPLPMFVLDLETFRFLDLNESAAHLYGYSHKEFLAMTALDIRPKEDKDAFLQLDHSYESNVGSNKGIWRHIKKDGSIINVEIFGHSITFENRKARLILVNDITEKLKAEQKLINSEKRFRALIEKSYDIIIMLDRDLNILYRSPSTGRITGRTDADVVGFDIRKHIHAGDIPKLDSKLEKLLLNPWNVEEFTFRYLHKNGHYIWFEGNATNLLHDESINAIVFNYRDVTERIVAEQQIRTSEKRFRALIEKSYDIITMLDKDFNVLYRSPSAKRVTGRENDDVIGLDGRKRIHPDDMMMVQEGIKRLLAAPGNVEECSFRYLHRNGSYLWIEGNATNLLQDENVNAIVFNYRDVTERVAAQEKVQESEKRFRSLIENGSDIINLLDSSFKVIYRSPSAARQNCLADADIMGADGRKRIHPDDLPAVTEGIKRLLAAPGNIESTIFRYKRNEDEYMWLEGTATNLLHDDAVKAIVFNYREVSDRIEAQEKLRTSEERYRSAFDNMIEGVQIIGFDWKYKYVNDAVVIQGKYNREELLGFTMMEKYPGIENTDLFTAMKNCMTERAPVVFENKFVYPDNTVAWFELSVQPVQEGIFILSVDITERVEAAEALREEKDKLLSIAATSPGLIYSFRMSPDGSLTFPFVSNAVEDIFGYPSEMAGEIVNPLLHSVLHDDLDLVTNSILQSAKTLQQWQLEFRFMHPSKGLRWLEGNSLPVKEKDGSILWHGIIMDITERKIAEERFIEKSAQVETLSNNLPGVMIYQLSGEDFANRKFTYVSKEVTRLTGKTPEQVIADPSVLYKMLLEEDIPAFIKAENDSYEKMSTFNEEVRFRNHTGEIRWLNIISTPRKTMDGKLVWDGFHVDITDRKKSEAALRNSYMEKRMLAEKLTTILNTLPANIALLDENGTIVDVNQSWMEFAAKNDWYGSNYGIGANYITLAENDGLFDYKPADKQKLAVGIREVLNKTADKFIYECHTLNKLHWFRKIVSQLSGDGYTGAVVMNIDVSQIHKLEEERLRIKTEEQKNITAAILQGQEKERNAIGKELHDNINQILAGINMLMGLLVKRPERINELLPLCIDNINLAIKENRKIAHELVAPGENAETLVEQVKNVAKNMLQNAGISTRVDHKHFDEALLSNEQRLAAYRVVQEQCNNIIKYSEAKNVVFLLHTSSTSFLLIIKDNGKGMDINKRTDGIGIQNIRNRVSVFNGHVSITTRPGGGFMLSVEIPLNKITELP